MTVAGIVLLFIGGIGTTGSLSMDTSVPTAYGRVENLGRISDRQVCLTVFVGVAIVGAIFLGFGAVITSGANSKPTVSQEEIDRLRRLLAERRQQDADRLLRMRKQYEKQCAINRERAHQRWAELGNVIRGIPGLIDNAVHKAVGLDNTLLYRFTQFLLYLLLPVLVCAALIIALR